MRFWKRILILLALISIIISLASCAKDSETVTDVTAPGLSADGALVSNLPNRKIVYSVSLSFKSTDISSLKKLIDSKSSSLSGYIEKNDERYDDGKCTYVSVVYRIPTEKLDEFLDFAEGKGRLTDKSVSTTDITTSYVNAEAKLKSLEEKKTLLEKMLEDSTPTSADRLNIITEISNVGTEIEEIKLLINGYDSSVSFSSVRVMITEPTPIIEILIPFILVGGFFAIPIIVVLVYAVKENRRKKKKALNQ